MVGIWRICIGRIRSQALHGQIKTLWHHKGKIERKERQDIGIIFFYHLIKEMYIIYTATTYW